MLSFFSAFVFCLVLTPFLIRYAAQRKWFDVPDQRKLHEEEIPRLGGVALTGSFLIGIFLSGSPEILLQYRYFLAGLLILFFVGVWDDLQPVKPLIKIVGELLPVVLLSFSAQLDFSALHLSLHSFAIPLTMVVTFWMINAFNLIDGINGLAGTIGIIALVGASFLIPESATLCLSMAGALLAFLFYNIRNPKIFLGDSGSLLIGYCLTFAATLEADTPLLKPGWLLILPLVSFPLFDMVRVFLIRIYKGRNPFQADRNHLHHLLLEAGLTHIGATALLTIVPVTNTVIAWFVMKDPWLVILVSVLIPLFFTLVIWQKVRKIRRTHNV